MRGLKLSGSANIPIDNMVYIEDVNPSVDDTELNDADTLGGRYTAEDLDAMPKSTAIEDYANVEAPLNDADILGGKYTAENIDELYNNFKVIYENINNILEIGAEINGGTWYSVASLTLPAGTYFIIGSCDIILSGNTPRNILQSIYANGSNLCSDSILTTQRYTQTTCIQTFSKETVVYLRVYISSNSDTANVHSRSILAYKIV